MEKDTKKCLCDEPQCAKCLSGNCKNDDCEGNSNSFSEGCMSYVEDNY